TILQRDEARAASHPTWFGVEQLKELMLLSMEELKAEGEHDPERGEASPAVRVKKKAASGARRNSEKKKEPPAEGSKHRWAAFATEQEENEEDEDEDEGDLGKGAKGELSALGTTESPRTPRLPRLPPAGVEPAPSPQ
ncbi:unnamed protein product, partial [Ectocarpus fasciculatus]